MSVYINVFQYYFLINSSRFVETIRRHHRVCIVVSYAVLYQYRLRFWCSDEELHKTKNTVN